MILLGVLINLNTFSDVLMAEFVRKFSSLKVNLLQIREDINVIIRKINMNNLEVPVETDFLRSFSFPIFEKQELEQIDNYLQNEDNFKQAVSFYLNIKHIFVILIRYCKEYFINLYIL